MTMTWRDPANGQTAAKCHRTAAGEMTVHRHHLTVDVVVIARRHRREEGQFLNIKIKNYVYRYTEAYQINWFLVCLFMRVYNGLFVCVYFRMW